MENRSGEMEDREIIITDEDTKNEDLYENGYPYEMPEEVDIREDHMSVFEWLRKIQQGKLILDPEFQRKLVWSADQKSKFVESVLLNIPLPPFYVNQNIEGKYIIVDGLQRTDTLQSFAREDGFKLQNLQVLKKLNDLGFKDLDASLQTKIEDKQLFLYVIKPSVPIPMVYDIFNRINTGGTQLNRQEIRNCIFIGKATRLLKELSETKYFRNAIDNGISPKRMKDREAVLRSLAFSILGYQKNYTGSMDDFLEMAMQSINAMNDDAINSLKERFKYAMEFSYYFFGEKNFRLPTEKTRGRINIALLESVCHFFLITPHNFLTENEAAIKRNYEKLLSSPIFIDAIKTSTGDKKRVFNRFNLVQQILGEV